ncbi:hypothetical protein BCR33DRAFT_739529 [Rhizoclosmatium globosum]|uniref:Uncharacterized protein n=1 Tax=Rhizoclosmatium globosum TaxID=329046 RepID=A0A1Y2C4T4_9FUNG|nr:hypothetical protein BCR33DRAFT_739529 [Rhizoclosmatium globosum]|eukprot:ORY42038.1 hypothetical protein BCR33DRAFT_739529 [Rhizoclosmatium globosum]
MGSRRGMLFGSDTKTKYQKMWTYTSFTQILKEEVVYKDNLYPILSAALGNLKPSKISTLFPQYIVKYFGTSLPTYDFIVQTSSNTITNVQNLLTLLDSWSPSEFQYTFHTESKTTIVTTGFAQAVDLRKDWFHSLDVLYGFASTVTRHYMELHSNVVVQCGDEFNSSTVFIQNCGTIEEKLDAFRQI